MPDGEAEGSVGVQISWQGIGLTYPGSPPVEALRATDLAIGPGEYWSVTGRSGAGKSTLLNVLGLLDAPSFGVARMGSLEVSAMSGRALAQVRAERIGFVFQQFHLLPNLTARENVELSLRYGGVARDDRSARATAALERVGLGGRADHRPSDLSGGEQQRVAIARAFARRQGLVLADEPTGNLDTASAEVVIDVIEDLVEHGRSVVLVTHDEQLARRPTHQLDVLDGRVRQVR